MREFIDNIIFGPEFLFIEFFLFFQLLPVVLSIFFQIVNVADESVDVFSLRMIVFVCVGLSLAFGDSFHPLDDLILFDDG